MSSVAYPPTARAPIVDHTPVALVSAQPAPMAGMSMQPATVDAFESEKREQTSAQRLRGGCIPCPDGSMCYIIPVSAS